MIDDPEIVLMIGNGFDLNIGLKTGYSDFINSNNFNKLINKNPLFWHLYQSHDLQKWIDIENELKAYSSSPNVPENFQSLFEELCNCLTDYLNDIDYNLINKSSTAHRLLDYIKNFNFLIINFNYTNTIENILGDFGMNDDEIKKRVIKIHGSVKTNDIIFGVEDNSRIKPSHVFLKKSYSPNFKRIKINKLLRDSAQVMFFGHSLGETDHMYLQGFFQQISSEVYDAKNVQIFYHGKSGYTELFIQLDALTSKQLAPMRQHNNFQFINTEVEKKLAVETDNHSESLLST